MRFTYAALTSRSAFIQGLLTLMVVYTGQIPVAAHKKNENKIISCPQGNNLEVFIII
jgi:hypothetical protein